MFKMPSMQYPASYRISVRGHLDTSWSDRLTGMSITATGGKDIPETTTLEGRLPDQAALAGILNTLYDLHMPVLSLECIDAE
jgi:hypothetical protein